MKKTRLTILGSGTCVPDLNRSSSSVLFETGDLETKILFDTGAGCSKRLMEAGASIFDISYIFYSHLHPDHTGELASILFSLKYSDAGERRKLTFVAAKGFSEFFEKLCTAYGSWIRPEPSLFGIIELDNEKSDSVTCGDITIHSEPVDHTDQSLAYRIITPDDKVIAISGDSEFCDGLRTISEHADLFVCESSHPDELKIAGHMTPSLAGRVANRSEVKKLVLTHFYPDCDSVDLKKQCRKIFKGEVVLAEDLMTFRV